MKQINGFPKYFATIDGEIFGPRGIRKSQDSYGYRTINLCHAGLKKTFLVHRLVYETFSGQPIPQGLCINHKNGIKHDNRFENLELMTHAENCLHAHRVLKYPQTKGNDTWCAKMNAELVREIRAAHLMGKGYKSLARKYGVDRTTIRAIVRREAWKHVP